MNSADSNTEQDRSHLGVIKDPNIKIQPGSTLKEYIETSSFKVLKDKTYLSIGDIKELYAAIQKEKDVYLNELIQGSEILLPELVIPPRNPELEKRINELKNFLAQKEYNRMTKNVNLTSRYKPEDSVSYQLKQMNSGLIGVFQFIVTVGAAFMFGFMGIEVFASAPFELAVKLLLGIICALIVACAELYFLLHTLDFAETSQGNSIKSKPLLSPLKKLHEKTL